MKAKKQQRFEEWVDAQLHADPDFNGQVEEALQTMHLEQDLVALREAQGISQEQLARTLGVSQPAIAKLESGRVKNIELRTLLRTVRALGGTIEIQIKKGTTRKPQRTERRARHAA